MNLTSYDITIFFLSLAVLLFFARAIGEVSRYLKQPLVIGEIIGGIILGPTIFGSLFPNEFNNLFNSSPTVMIALQGMIILGVVMLLLVSGIEIDLLIIIRQSKTASLVSIMGIIAPFSIGFLIAYFFPERLGISDLNMRLVFALFVGTALSITALPVVARTLMDLNILKTDIGLVIIASAMFDDLIGWIIFSVILGIIGQNTHGQGFGTLIILLFGFVIFMFLIGRKIIDFILPYLERFTTKPGGILNFVIVLGFLGAAFTEYIGVHAIFGAFIIGIAVGDSVHLKQETREVIQQFATNIFAPIFFVSIGLRVNFIENFDFGIVALFLILAFLGKVIGCGIGAYWGGMNKEESLAVGFGMNSRGAMEIVLGTLALQSGLIQEKVFVALVIMALVTSISSAPLMSYFIKKSRRLLSFVSLVKSENVFFSNAESKNELIKELCNKISIYHKLSNEKLLTEVMAREELISTGLEKHLAIPHAKVNVPNPLIAVALHKQGIDFDSLDGLPAKLIILLITPKNDPELQLKLLAEISKTLGDVNKINKLVGSENATEFVINLKQLS